MGHTTGARGFFWAKGLHLLTAGRRGCFFFLSPEKEAKRARGGGKLAARDCLPLWTPPAPPLALNRLLCSPPAPRRGDPVRSAPLVCPCAGSNPHPATAPADAPAHYHYRWVQHSHAPAQPPPHQKNAALLAAAPQPIRSGVRRICGGLLPLKAEIQSNPPQPEPPDYAAAPHTLRHHTGGRGGIDRSIPPSGFPPLSTGESGLPPA